MKKVLIEIPDEEIYLYMSYGGTNGQRLMGYIANGKFLPDNPTNGDMIMAVFPNAEIKIHEQWDGQNIVTVRMNGVQIVVNSLDWWNAPYRKDGEIYEN